LLYGHDKSSSPYLLGMIKYVGLMNQTPTREISNMGLMNQIPTNLFGFDK